MATATKTTRTCPPKAQKAQHSLTFQSQPSNLIVFKPNTLSLSSAIFIAP